jgi:alanine dehydrogenase
MRPPEAASSRPPLFLDRATVERVLTPALCLEAVESAFRSLARDQAIQPLRTLLTLPGAREGSPANHFLVMPAHVQNPPALGAKLITLFPGNHALGIPSHQGVILFFDVETGGLRAVVDAESVTALRTAAASALATQHLAREDAEVLAILGSGVQARSHLEAILAVRPIREVRVWSRTRANAQAFVEEMSSLQEAHPFPSGPVAIQVASDPEAAVRGAQIVCTLTASPTPVVQGEWLDSGSHVNAVGAYTAQTRELDSRAVAQARLFVDRRASALAEAGDYLIPRSEGVIDDQHIAGEIGDLVEGRVSGRTSLGDRTVFKSLGLAVQDLAAVSALVQALDAEASM